MGPGGRLQGGACFPAVIHPVKSTGEQASRGTLATQPWAHERAKQDPTQMDNMNYKTSVASQRKMKTHTYEASRLCCGMLRDQEALRLAEVKMDPQQRMCWLEKVFKGE